MACLDVQHDCHNGKCKTIETMIPPQGSHIEGHILLRKIAHTDDENYILNVCSHHAARYHQMVSNLTFTPPNQYQIHEIVESSVQKWAAKEKKKAQQKRMGKERVGP